MSRYPLSQWALRERALRDPLDFREKAHHLASFTEAGAGITNRAAW